MSVEIKIAIEDLEFMEHASFVPRPAVELPNKINPKEEPLILNSDTESDTDLTLDLI